MSTTHLLLLAAGSLLVFLATLRLQDILKVDLLKTAEEAHEEGELSSGLYASSLGLGCISALALLVVGAGSGWMFILCVMALFWN